MKEGKHMLELQNFTFQGSQVRTIQINGQTYFIGKDVASILGYVNTRKALIDHVDDEDKDGVPIRDAIGRTQNAMAVNESGLYSLILSSKLQRAKKFKHWVTSVVLPSIRQTGSYQQAEPAYDIPGTYGQALQLAADQQKQLELQKPKVIFADAVAASKTSILVGELAKLLKQNGVVIGQNRLFTWLRDNNYLIARKGTDYNMPTQRAMELQLFSIKETSITHSDGHVTISKTPKVTGKGQQYFINKFLQPKYFDLSYQKSHMEMTNNA